MSIHAKAWRSSGVALALSLGLTCIASAASAGGIRAELEFRDAKLGKTVDRAVVWVSDRRVRVEQRSRAGHERSYTLIYRGDRDVFYSLDPSDRAYLEIDRSVIVSLGQRLHAARREMTARLERLPPDQRAMAERLIGARETAEIDSRFPLVVRPVAGGAEQSGRPCRRVKLTRKDVIVGDACVLDWSILGITAEDMGILRDLGHLQRELMGARHLTPMEIVPDQPLYILAQLDGFPLRYRRLRNGEPVSSIVVTALEIGDLDDSLFQIPSSYAQRRGGMPFLAGHPGSDGAPAAPASR